ncbi:MAG: hypothetical protein DI526_17025 [Caulobacter segnis]|uniref:Uncharacterized protein n=1 Tax=Caulobacter segnis TaxID=88688 RepID=A0A2W5V0M5_9CAUL|nr:MAG: hypothetical protein DI526_17025 [Caulobacter segnis]
MGALLAVVVGGWRKDAAVLKACVAAVSGKGRADLDPATVCPRPIAADRLAAVRSRACDAALSASPENLYGAATSCSGPVKRVQAERDVARGEAARLTNDLNNERLGQDAAIARAAASAATQAERKARAAAALQAAPRDAGGLVVCDADCMRARWATGGERP